jgi:DNA polymerase (family 10)
MGRRDASEALTELAFAAELLGDAAPLAIDVAAVTALAWSARSAESATTTAMAHLPGMSPALLAVVDDALAGRPSPTLQSFKSLLPPGLFELRRLKGLGPKKVKRLWQVLGIESLGELEYACRENRLVTLDGFGEKTQADLRRQLAALADETGLMRRDTALALVHDWLGAARVLGHRVEVAGGLRRGAELVDGVVLVSSLAVNDVAVSPRVTVIVARPGRFGVDLIVATGSEAHVTALRARAAARGLDFDALVGDDEADVYAQLGLLPTAPELREEGTLVEVGRAEPRLLRRSDIRGALHNHTTASDGADDLVTMARAAAAEGLSWLGISDHSVFAAYAHGLDGPRLAEQRAQIAALSVADVAVLSGVESDIMRDGSLDLTDDVLAAGEVVIASMHQRFSLGAAAMTSRLIHAASHPLVDVLGHPTGRLLLSRRPAEFDVVAVLEACARHTTAVELNANPARLDFGVTWLREAKARGVLVSIAADAHAASELAHLEHGLAIARRAGLGPDDVLNTWSIAELRAWLLGRRQRANVQGENA